MNITGILYDLEVSPESKGNFQLQWRWNDRLIKVAYFQISHSQQTDLNKTYYSPYISAEAKSRYTIHHVQPDKIYQICLTVFFKNIPEDQLKGKVGFYDTLDASKVMNRNKVCLQSMISTNHLLTILYCFLGVILAFILLFFIGVLCRVEKNRIKRESLRGSLKGANKNYYERHRNSVTTITTPDDYSNFDEYDSSYTSQMISESLAWSPNNSFYNQQNLVAFKSKSVQQNHSSSYLSSTPRIMEEDGFLEAFVDKVPTEDEIKTQEIFDTPPEQTLDESFTSPYFANVSSSTLTSVNDNYLPINDLNISNDLVISNDQGLLKDQSNDRGYESDLVLQLIENV